MKEEASRDPDKAGPGGLNPLELRGAALDKLVAAGVLPPERRPADAGAFYFDALTAL